MATPTPATRKQITLTPEARAAIPTPLTANPVGQIFEAGTGSHFASIYSRGDSRIDGEIAAFIAALVNEALTPAAPAARFCDYEDCTCDPLPGFDFCAYHQSEHDTNIRAAIAANAPVEPETTTELAQIITTEFESATLAAQYTAANDARREG